MFSKFKNNLLGYIFLFAFAVIIMKSRLIIFFVFLMFLYLLTDIFTNDIHKKYPSLSVKFLFYLFYLLLISAFFILSFKVIPKFISDFPKYFNLIEYEIAKSVKLISDAYDIGFEYNDFKQSLFSDEVQSIKQFVVLFKGISVGISYFIFAIVLNFLLFIEKNKISEMFNLKKGSIMAYLFNFLNEKVGIFYLFFKKIMGGQVIISCINTIITLGIVMILNLPHKITLVCLVFVCGLFPIIGNLISNTILSVTALISQGVVPCIICLIFLIGIHKLEYFLNSRIVGRIAKLPMSVTLLALLISEVMFGIWGILVAIPLFLFIKNEFEELSSST
ncbi:MAG: AI-2E family transporter [Elusimicrobia bacterium]|nr:AI-2E family transporter [Elusimicrobiota bacterium]